MTRRVFLILFSFLLITSFKTDSPKKPSFKEICLTYNIMDGLYSRSNTSDKTDSVCMKGFRQVILDLGQLPEKKERDSIMYQSNYKLGILYELYRDYAKATAAYIQAIRYAFLPNEKFRAIVLAGAGYYNLNNFDSASYFLLHAADSSKALGRFEDWERLYNTLGVLYYDNGNYLQSKNYFIHALNLIKKNNPKAILDENTIQLNIATCFYNLGMYSQALHLYTEIQHRQLMSDAYFMNVGRTHTGLHDYIAAMAAFKKVKIKLIPGVLNEMAKTALEAGNPDSASHWLEEYRKVSASLHTNALDNGINELYLGDLNIFLGKPESAMPHLQEALIIFSRNFSDKDIRKNPSGFSRSFAYYRLFEVFVKKAAAWEMLYKKDSNTDALRSAYDTYQCAVTLISYIEKSYETDNAKILLKQRSGEVYSKALTVCLALNKLFPKEDFLEVAFQISEKNKASIMRSQIRERNFLMSESAENQFVARERNLRFNIARLYSKAEEGLDAQALVKIDEEKSDYETQLVQLRREMEGDNQFYQWKYSDDFPDIKQLQDKMSQEQALISFYNEPDKIQIFVLTKSSLNHIQLDSGKNILNRAQSWIRYLQNAESGRHENAKTLKNELYNQLMNPLLKLAGEKKEWIIIPDGLFFMLPIESLSIDSKGTLVLEKHAVTYEFSAGFITQDKLKPSSAQLENTVLSFAPFSKQGADLKKEGMGRLEKLPYSSEEIRGLKGLSFVDRQATKKEFITNLNRYAVVHLATHAVTDLENPSASYIAFFPLKGNRNADFLYLDEIYSLRMDSCQMIVISACETGRGELVKNEGVMSFARAFLYSGCPSTINTLWKADDMSTSKILKSFYIYLNAGYSKSEALQKAKLDFINENPVYRDPTYWSHIVLTGNPAALYKTKQPWIWATFLIIFGTVLIFLIGKRNKKKVDAFHN